MNYSSIAQLALLVIAIAIVVTYIRPSFAEIQDIQSTAAAYQDTLDKANELNMQLNSLVQEAQSISAANLDALDVYLPNEIDDLTVMSDLKEIADRAGVQVQSLATGEESGAKVVSAYSDPDMAGSALAYRDYTIIVTGTYETFKSFLSLTEQNKYPLEVVALSFGATSDTAAATQKKADVPDGAYSFTIRTYAYGAATSE